MSPSNEGMHEAAWVRARQGKHPKEPYTRRELKELVYGTTKPTLELETQKMRELMFTVLCDLARLQAAFPGGFTPFHDEVTRWKQGTK